MTHPKYWLARHSSKPDDVKLVFKLAEMLVARVPPPWEPAKRGRRPKFSARTHAAICITAVWLNLTYREVEGDPESNVSKLLAENRSFRLLEDQNTEPRVYYIGYPPPGEKVRELDRFTQRAEIAVPRASLLERGEAR